MSVPLPFEYRTIDGIHCAVGGSGPPLLLLHGYPQTHVIWHRVAPLLAEHFTVVAADLRGYGDSKKPPPDTVNYTKRAMAGDQVTVMRELGFARFAVAGHDRGGRVAHRMALDHPDTVTALAVLDIVPTRYTFANAGKDFGLGYYHWFFLAAGNGIPEHLIGGDPEFWVRTRMTSRHSGGTAFDPAALDEYVRCFSTPAAIAASCADYRAAATIDLEHDEESAGTPVTCPVLALWGEHSFVGRTYDVLSAWREYATNPGGHPVPSDHYLPEEAPEEVAAALITFAVSSA
jgi:haloacetate dehalogenase